MVGFNFTSVKLKTDYGAACASLGHRYNHRKIQVRTVGKIRDAKRTRQRILDAAAREFSRKGFDGTTMLGISRRAKVSKQLTTHHFGTKERLFEQVLDLKFRPMLEAQQRPAPSRVPADLFAERFKNRSGYVDYIRFLTWEAASGRRAALPGHVARKRRTASFGEALRQMQAAGNLPRELDHTMIQLAVLALATYPVAFGQMTRLVTGHAPTDPEFQKKWDAFLRCLGDRLLSVKKAPA